MNDWAVQEVPGKPSDPGPGRQAVPTAHPTPSAQPPRPCLSPAPTPQTPPLTFFLGLVPLHPIRHLPQRVKEEVALLLADDLGWAGRAEGGRQGESLPRAWLQLAHLWPGRPGALLGGPPLLGGLSPQWAACGLHQSTCSHPDSLRAVRGLAQHRRQLPPPPARGVAAPCPRS